MIETINRKIDAAMSNKREADTYSRHMIMVVKSDNRKIKLIPRESNRGYCDIQLVFETIIDNRIYARDLMVCPETLVDLGLAIMNYIEFLKTYEEEKK